MGISHAANTNNAAIKAAITQIDLNFKAVIRPSQKSINIRPEKRKRETWIYRLYEDPGGTVKFICKKVFKIGKNGNFRDFCLKNRVKELEIFQK
jgi:hypothetical protein